MAYTRVGWEDTPSEKTPLNAENLNHMDEAIENLYKGKLDNNGNASNTTATFEESEEVQSLSSGAKLSTLFGVIAKAVKDLIIHLANDTIHHTHGNKTTLDATTAAYTEEEKEKLGGIANGANKYAHPTSSGNKHIPSGGSSGQILRWSADGTATWGADNNTTYSNMTGATTSAAGKAGLVPAPAAGANGKYLRGDGTWQTPTDTKNTAGATNTSGKIYLIGATAQTANPQTFSHDTAFIGTDGCVYSGGKKTSVEGHTHTIATLASDSYEVLDEDGSFNVYVYDSDGSTRGLLVQGDAASEFTKFLQGFYNGSCFDIFGQHNSNRCVISDTAPSDTSALWVS